MTWQQVTASGSKVAHCVDPLYTFLLFDKMDTYTYLPLHYAKIKTATVTGQTIENWLLYVQHSRYEHADTMAQQQNHNYNIGTQTLY